MNNITMNNGLSIPQIGYGTWQAAEGEEAIQGVVNAIKGGYRHIDTAAVYGNERSVGEGIRQSGIAREELFVTSKVWNDMRGEENCLKAFDETMEKLGLDYLDLYLVHWPANESYNENWKELNASTWRGMEKILASGRVKSIGVSNFLPQYLDALMETAKVIPVVNQIEFHPGFMQSEVVANSLAHGLQIEAWSPIGSGSLLKDELLLKLAEKYGKSSAQICIRWCMQHNTIVLPKSVNADRMMQNLTVDDFEISAEDMDIIDAMPTTAFSGLDPHTVNF